jgi:hypothetical protein
MSETFHVVPVAAQVFSACKTDADTTCTGVAAPPPPA